MKIYILTLASTVESYDITVKRLIEAGFNESQLVKHLGIHGVKEPKLLAYAALKWNCSKDPYPAQQGCSFAHLDAMEKFLVTDDEYCMIIENDLLLPSNFMDMFQDVMKEASNYDILFIGWEDLLMYRPKRSEPKLIPYHPLCMHCYVVSRVGARKICETIKKNGLTTILDVWIANRAEELGIISLCVNPHSYNFTIPLTARMNRANGIAFQDGAIPSTIDI